MTKFELIKLTYLTELITSATITDGELQELNMLLKKQKEEILSAHPWAISKGKDGKWRSYLPDETKGRIQIKLSSKESLENRICEFYLMGKNQTLDELFKAAKARALEKGRKSATIDEYDKIWKKFLIDFKNANISQINSSTFKSWFKHWHKIHGKISKSQFNKLRNAIYLIFSYCESEELIRFDYRTAMRKVLNDIDLYTAPEKKSSVDELIFTKDEQNALINYCRKHPDSKNLAILLLLDTAMRPGEVVALNIDSINLEGYISVTRCVTRYTEDGHQVYRIQDSTKTASGTRTVVVSNECLDVLADIYNRADENGNVFSDITVKQLTDRIRTICKSQLKITVKSINKLRKTASTNMYINGVSERDIIAQDGHTSINTTLKHYIQTNVDAKMRRERLEKIKGNQG